MWCETRGSFDAEAANCFKPEDKEKIFGLIAQGCGTLTAFNEIVRLAFTQAATASFAQPYATLRGSFTHSVLASLSGDATGPQDARESDMSLGGSFALGGNRRGSGGAARISSGQDGTTRDRPRVDV